MQWDIFKALHLRFQDNEALHDIPGLHISQQISLYVAQQYFFFSTNSPFWAYSYLHVHEEEGISSLCAALFILSYPILAGYLLVNFLSAGSMVTWGLPRLGTGIWYWSHSSLSLGQPIWNSFKAFSQLFYLIKLSSVTFDGMHPFRDCITIWGFTIIELQVFLNMITETHNNFFRSWRRNLSNFRFFRCKFIEMKRRYF